MPVRIDVRDGELEATLRWHLRDLVDLPGPPVIVGEEADVVVRQGYLRPRALPYPVSRALARLGREPPLHAKLVERTAAVRRRVRARLGLCGGSGPRFLLRVDDFNRWDRPLSEFLAFHRTLGGQPYLLAVTPRLALDPLDPDDRRTRPLSEDERAALAEARASGARMALHGLTHRTLRRRPHSELAGLGETAVGELCDEALALLEGPVDAFVPPFNHFDPAAFRALSRRFSVICGGPESIRPFGFFTSPAVLGGALYVPSYSPAYGRAAELERFARTLVRRVDEEVWVPLTLHWAWETRDRFRGVQGLLETIAGRVHPWDDLMPPV